MTEKTMGLVMEIAQQMVESGAEIGRVEESIIRICQAYGCVRTDAYATLSSMIVTAETEDGCFYTQSRRIKQTAPDMERLHRLNGLVRYLSDYAPADDYIVARLEEIRRLKPYPFGIQVLFNSLIAGSFCLFFGGRDFLEILFSFLIGAAVGVIGKGLDQIRSNRILSRFVCSLFAGLSALALLRIGWIGTVDNIIIGNIMSLIPGTGLTNALRDLFTGDTITGILRLMEALLLASAIALGFLASVYVTGGAV